MPRIYGTPSAKSFARLQSRGDFDAAIRSNDQKSLHVWNDDDDDYSGPIPGANMVGLAALTAGVRTNQFDGFLSYINAGTKLVWAAARAVDIVANVIISTEMEISWRDGEKKSPVSKIDKDLRRLILNPNPYDTISELLYLWVSHMEYCGNAFWLKDEMDGAGRPKNIFALNPIFMVIVPDKQRRVSHYLYRINGSEVRFEVDEIMHFRRPNADGSLFGIGSIGSAESLYDEFINRSLYNSRMMANGAMPSGLLVNENYEGSQDEWERMQKSFNDKYSGVKNTGKVAWMNGKWSLLQMGMTSQAMQEMERGRVNVEQIFLNHGVPLSVAGVEGAANYATAKIYDISFRRYKVLPMINMFIDVMNSPRGFIPAFSPDIRIDFSLSGLVDMEQVGKDTQWLADRGGLSANDLRELVGYPRKNDPFLDQYFVSSHLVPIEIAGIRATEPTGVVARGAPLPPTPPPDPQKQPVLEKPKKDATP